MSAFKNINDITHDLKSLGFESGLSAEELKYLPLRARSHAFTVCICANIAYLVAKLNEIREILSEIRHPVNRKTLKFVKRLSYRDAIKVGIIGCGRLGTQIVTTLTTFSDVRPDEIMISTRRPHELVSFRESGIECFFDNNKIVQNCHIVFLACLPCQIQTVAEEICDNIPRDCIIYSVVTAVSLPRLKQLFRHNNIVKTDFTWPTQPDDPIWPVGCEVSDTLKQAEFAELTCPVSDRAKADAIVWPSQKLSEIALYSALNMCPMLNITADEAIDLMNVAFIGPNRKELDWSKFLDEASNEFVKEGNLPVFDLFHVGTNDTPLTEVLTNDLEIRKSLTKRFCLVFDRFRSTDTKT